MPPETELLDLAQLQRLQVFEEPEIRAIVDAFAAELHDRIHGIESALADPAKLQKLLHETRGAASNCGFIAVETLCRKFESFPESFDITALQDAVARSRQAWQTLSASNT